MIKKAIILFISISLANCSRGKEYDNFLNVLYKNTVPIIKPDQLVNEIKNDSCLIILDTREPEEFKVSHILNAKNVGYDYFIMDSLKMIQKNSRIIVYCAVGYRSERIGEKLLANGYTKVYNLYGGIFEWVNNDYPIVDTKNLQTNKIHPYSAFWGQWLLKGEKDYGN